eukprot:7425369-Pyramimonas_sp.AAC.3
MSCSIRTRVSRASLGRYTNSEFQIPNATFWISNPESRSNDVDRTASGGGEERIRSVRVRLPVCGRPLSAHPARRRSWQRAAQW